MKEKRFSTGTAAVLENKRKTGCQRGSGRAGEFRLKDAKVESCDGYGVNGSLVRESDGVCDHSMARDQDNDFPCLDYLEFADDLFHEPKIEGYIEHTLSDVLGDLSTEELMYLLETYRNGG